MGVFDEVAAQWPEWIFGRSRHGRYVMATRRVALPRGAIDRGLSMTHIEESIPDLVERLRLEADREARLW